MNRCAATAARVLAWAVLPLGASSTAVERSGDVPLGHPDFRPSPAHPVGFRGDWTGRYPGAAPPAEWSFHHNVLWRTVVGNGEASVLVIGSRLYTLSDGARLMCLDKVTGTVLWQREHHARGDAPEESKAWKLEEYVLLHHRARPHLRAAEQARRERQNLEKDAARAGKTADAARMAALQQTADDAMKAAAVFQDKQKELDPAALGVREAATYAIATPCSDGRWVYAYLPLGEVVAYDLDGNLQWVRFLGGEKRAGGGWGGAQVGPSPALADGKLVVHYDKFYGIDAATGRILWETPTRGLPIPSPIPGRRGNAWYAMMGNGQMLGLADGAIVFDPPWKGDCTVHSPIFYDDLFCWVGAAVRLPAAPGSKAVEGWSMDPRDLEQVDAMKPGTLKGPKPMLGWHGYSCPVYDEGLVYFQAEHQKFSAFDARTGKLVFNTGIPCNGEIYPGAVLAGDRLFLANRGGRMLMVSRGVGPDHRILGENNLPVDLGGNMPVFDGSRFYLRMQVRGGRGVPDFGEGDAGILFCIGDPLSPPPVPDGPTPEPPEILARLADTNDAVAFAAARALKADPAKGAVLLPDLVKRLDDKDPRRLRITLLALRALGPSAAEAALRVIPFLGTIPYGGGTPQMDLYRAARDALRAMGPSTVPALVKGLTLTSPEWGWRPHGIPAVIARLGELGPAAREAVPALVGMLRTGSHSDIRAAWAALRSLDAAVLKTEGVSALAGRLQDARATMEKRTAAELLGTLGPAAAAAVSALEAATKDADAETARRAREALQTIRPQP